MSYFSTNWQEEEKSNMLSLASNFSDYVNELCLIHATVCGHLESTLTVISYSHSQAFMSALDVYDC